MADLWGAKQIVGEWDDDKGLSACLVFNDKLQIGTGKMSFKRITLSNLLGQNPAYVRSSRLKGGRSKFFSQYTKRHQVSLIQKYARYTVKENLRYSVIRILCSLHIDKAIKNLLKK